MSDETRRADKKDASKQVPRQIASALSKAWSSPMVQPTKRRRRPKTEEGS